MFSGNLDLTKNQSHAGRVISAASGAYESANAVSVPTPDHTKGGESNMRGVTTMSGTANSGKVSTLVRFDSDGTVVFGVWDFQKSSATFDGKGSGMVTRTKTTETVDGKEVSRTVVSATVENGGKGLPAPKDIRAIAASVGAIARAAKESYGAIVVNSALSKQLVKLEKLREDLVKLGADTTAIDASIVSLREAVSAEAESESDDEDSPDEADEADEAESE